MASPRIPDTGFCPGSRVHLPPDSLISAVLLAILLFFAPAALADCVGPAALESSLKTDPTAQGFAQLGNWFGHRGQFACAAQALQSAVRLNPDAPQLNYLLGLALYESHDFTHAIQPLLQVTSASPSSLRPHLLLASVYMYLSQSKDAAQQWRAALAIDAGNSMALHGLSHCLIVLGDYPAEIHLLHDAALDPNLTLDLAAADTSMGLYHDAMSSLHAALGNSPASDPVRPALHAMLAWVLLMEHQPAAALPEARKADAAAPSLLVAQISLGRALLETGSVTAALHVLEPASTQNPGNLELHIDLAHAYADAGHPRLARRERLICLRMVKNSSEPSAPMGSQEGAPPAQ